MNSRASSPEFSSRPFRIVHVHSHDRGGGAEHTVRLHHEQLLKCGHESTWFVAHQTASDANVKLIPTVRGPRGLHRAAQWAERLAGLQYIYSPSFRSLVRDLHKRFDIAHLHALHGAAGYADVGGLITLARRMPVVLTVNDLWLLTGHCAYPLDCPRWRTGCGQCPDLGRYPAVAKDGTRWNWRRKKRVFASCEVDLIAPSQWVAEQVRSSPILGRLPIHVVPNPVDTSVFRPGDQAGARNRLQLPRDAQIVLMAAQSLSNPFKGSADAIATINRLTNRETLIVVIGRDADEFVRHVQLPARPVAYQDDQAQLVDYYRAADVFLMPSKCETFGMTAAEAMACGTPVVAYAAGGLSDVVGGDQCGQLVPQGDVAGLSRALNELLADGERRAVMSGRGVERVGREFSLTRHTELCLQVYATAIQRRREAPAVRASGAAL